METSLVSYAFPTEIKKVGNLAYDFLTLENGDIIRQYDLAKLKQLVSVDDELKALILEVREHRSKLSICT